MPSQGQSTENPLKTLYDKCIPWNSLSAPCYRNNSTSMYQQHILSKVDPDVRLISQIKYHISKVESLLQTQFEEGISLTNHLALHCFFSSQECYRMLSGMEVSESVWVAFTQVDKILRKYIEFLKNQREEMIYFSESYHFGTYQKHHFGPFERSQRVSNSVKELISALETFLQRLLQTNYANLEVSAIMV